MKKKVSNKKTKGESYMLIARMVACILVIVSALLQILKIYNKAIYISAPLLGIVFLISSIQEWEKNRGAAIFHIVGASILLIATIVALLV